MPGRLKSVFAAVALIMAMIATTAATAGAADWHTANNGAYAGADNSGFKFTFATGPVVFACTGNPTISGTVNASPAAGTNPWPTFATGTIAPVGPCTVAGAAGYSATCASTSIGTGDGTVAGTYVGGVGAPPASNGGQSKITMAISCAVKLGPFTCTTVAGSVSGTYTNPANPNPGLLLLSSVGQTLTNGASGCAALPASSSVTMTDGAGVSLIFSLTNPAAPANQPYLWYG